MVGNLEMIVFDVELGNAIWVSTPSGRSMMFDIGRRADFSPLYWIRQNRTRVLNALVITHPHLDHVNDIENLSAFNLHSFYRPCHLTKSDVVAGNTRNGKLPDEESVERYCRLCTQFPPIYASDSRIANVGRWSWRDGMDFEVFQPNRLSVTNLNNHSLVTFVSFNGVKIMLPGDCEKAAWNELLDNHEFVSRLKDVRILVAPHHGRDSSYSPELMAKMNPDVCIISDGSAPKTAVTSKYDYHCKVGTYKIRGAYQCGRKCISTRRDGHVVVTIKGGVNSYGSFDLVTV